MKKLFEILFLKNLYCFVYVYVYVYQNVEHFPVKIVASKNEYKRMYLDFKKGVILMHIE